MHPAANRHTHLLQGIESIRALAERADRNAIDHLLTHPAADHLDDHTLDFLRHAQDLILITTHTLTTTLGAQATASSRSRPTTPDHTTPLDAAEAWRRAHLYLPTRDEEPILIHVQEFQDGYRAIPILLAVPEPPPVPTIESATTLVIDKTTGAVTRWPLLPLDVLASQYRCYKREEPLTFDGHRQ
ncbi:hypothetical protein [Actinomadura bangladeshensis]|uniref:Uncharacterized protein n=1 Tax=Actinomadura bangladeshensis TaxID=453573 RepID=A0A6L9QY34_9ACTN|nr:hypothetical protein [Actinomadura bangladeshensis]NEA29493.1 hypothetical protein [Actinomadura bangladeshensis]